MVIAVTPKFVSGDESLQSPPFATDCRPRFIVMSPVIWEFVNTFACEVTPPEKWICVTCPDDDVITKRIAALDLPIPRGAGQKMLPDPVFLTLIALGQLIAVEEWNEIEMRAAATYGPVQEPIVDSSVNNSDFLVEYRRP
jgi:hypothetical protein